MKVDRAEFTGLILAGGIGSLNSGSDRGLQTHLGMPIALHVLLRLMPQVGQLMINANSNLAAYESMGVPVWPDAVPGEAGLLTGWLTGLEQCATPHLVTVPCDALHFPVDLVERLATGLADAGAEIAMVVTRENGVGRTQPAFCLVEATLLESLAEFLRAGDKEFERYIGEHRYVEVVFDDSSAFRNGR